MKKYFLIIALFSLIFLGLGNYTSAKTEAECQPPYADCIQLCNLNPNTDYTNCTSTCSDKKTQCLATFVPPTVTTEDETTPTCNGIMVDNGMGGKECCDAQCQSVRTSLIGTPCDSPKGGTMGGANLICSCPQGTKNIHGTCIACNTPGVCCGIQLNTSVPFIGKCIEDVKTNQGTDETSVTGATAFPTLMGSLTKILVTLILIISFVLIIIGGIMIATGNPSGGKKMIVNVVIAIALLGASGVILRLINPNFFG